jgi:hypothetical protein
MLADLQTSKMAKTVARYLQMKAVRAPPNLKTCLTLISQTGGFLPQASRSSGDGSGKRLIWTLSFYSQFFDVDTNEVLRRCGAAIYPRANFLDVLEGNPDLYGPFWIATTVVVILFLTGTISQYLAREKGKHFEYDFKLLSGEIFEDGGFRFYGRLTGKVFRFCGFDLRLYWYGRGISPGDVAANECFKGVIPIALWGILKWFGSESANLLECWALYGYANLVWILVAIVSWSPIKGELSVSVYWYNIDADAK